MPYIKPEDRAHYDSIVDALTHKLIEHGANAGDINYCFSRMLWNIFDKKGGRYAHANEIMGAVACIQAEFYRRKVAPYEDLKIGENGDVRGL
ncbi:MAG: hypothetical protein A2Y14_04980 [Verrucomicrobia bacterium GWF2_51_19]|nr:MAG: hypothetical protein A2Y14_04980 [Verrucomicrobia bacterium GWF2_51_19]HCJ11644.1 hypothetical protein [Opitutae bacterium]